MELPCLLEVLVSVPAGFLTRESSCSLRGWFSLGPLTRAFPQVSARQRTRWQASGRVWMAHEPEYPVRCLSLCGPHSANAAPLSPRTRDGLDAPLVAVQEPGWEQVFRSVTGVVVAAVEPGIPVLAGQRAGRPSSGQLGGTRKAQGDPPGQQQAAGPAAEGLGSPS